LGTVAAAAGREEGLDGVLDGVLNVRSSSTAVNFLPAAELGGAVGAGDLPGEPGVMRMACHRARTPRGCFASS
jgi:hypothetical protein